MRRATATTLRVIFLTSLGWVLLNFALFLTLTNPGIPQRPVTMYSLKGVRAVVPATLPTSSCPPVPVKQPTNLMPSPTTGISGSRSWPPGSHHLCIVVPFRDRFEELMYFVPYMIRFLVDQNVHFDILVVQQVDGFRFNRASLINAGYYEAAAVGCDYMAMHDVDLLPLNPNLTYGHFPADRPLHLASPEYHPRYAYPSFIGGILLITLKHFRLVNGMSNRYWGWGLEDDEFYVRLREVDLIPSRPANLTTGRDRTFIHIHSSGKRPRDNVRLFAQRRISRRRDRVSGLDTLNYSVILRRDIKVQEFGAIVINVQLACDLTFSPWCEYHYGNSDQNTAHQPKQQ